MKAKAKRKVKTNSIVPKKQRAQGRRSTKLDKPLDKPLTIKQKEFAKQYVLTYYNGVQSYMKAYKTDNYGTAGVEATRLLKNPRIWEEIDRLKKNAEEATGMSPTAMVNDLIKIAEAHKRRDGKTSIASYSLIADVLGYKNNSKAPVVIVNNNLFKDSEEEFQNAIEI